MTSPPPAQMIGHHVNTLQPPQLPPKEVPKVPAGAIFWTARAASARTSS